MVTKNRKTPPLAHCVLSIMWRMYIYYMSVWCHCAIVASFFLLSSLYACTNRDKSQSGKTFAYIEYQDLSLTASWDALYNFCLNCILYTLVWTKLYSIGLSWPSHVSHSHTHDSTLKICWHCEKGHNLCVALLSFNDDVTRVCKIPIYFQYRYSVFVGIEFSIPVLIPVSIFHL